MAHLSYKEFKERFGDLGVTYWVKYNWLGVEPAQDEMKGKWVFTTQNINYFSNSGFKTKLTLESSTTINITTNGLLKNSSGEYQIKRMKIATNGSILFSNDASLATTYGGGINKTPLGSYIIFDSILISKLKELNIYDDILEDLKGTHTKEA